MTPDEVRRIIEESNRISFSKRVGDTPTDALQLVPKKYVSSVAASLVSAINAVASFSGVTPAGGSDKQIQYNNSGGFGGDPALTWSGSVLTVGQPGSVIGNVRIAGRTSGTVQVQTASNAGNWTFTVPANDGDANQVLVTDGNGVTSWITALLPGVGTAKGDLIAFSGASVAARLPVGTNGQYLIASSAETLGVKWDSVTSGGSGSPGGSNSQIQYNGGSSFAGALVTYVDETADGHTPTLTASASLVSFVIRTKDNPTSTVGLISKNAGITINPSVFTLNSINFNGGTIRINRGGSVSGAGGIDIFGGQSSVVTGSGPINMISGTPATGLAFGVGGNIYIGVGSSLGGSSGGSLVIEGGRGTITSALGAGHVSQGGNIDLLPGKADIETVTDGQTIYGTVRVIRPTNSSAVGGGFFGLPVVQGFASFNGSVGVAEMYYDNVSSVIRIYNIAAGWKTIVPV